LVVGILPETDGESRLEEYALKLSIVIVNWNATEFLEGCLTSLIRKDAGVPWEIIVVDNASDLSPRSTVTRHPGVHFIENSSNAGFAKANNQAMESAKGEYILLLNPDTVIADTAIFRDWIGFMDARPDVGASGCKLVFPDGRHQVGDAGFRPSLGTVFNFSFFLSRILPYTFKGLFITRGSLSRAMEVDWVCGADFLVRKSILSRTGLMDESIFLYAEDVEWGCRIRSFGYKICYLPFFKIMHFQGASSKHTNPVRGVSFLWLENLRRLYSHYNRNQPLILLDAMLLSGYLLRALLYSLLSLRKGDAASRKKVPQMFQNVGYLFKTILRGSHVQEHFRKPQNSPENA
jgi:N-acetylglucosaminyl-diphospho-decaprenol L-rhamnosyltransferase